MITFKPGAWCPAMDGTRLADTSFANDLVRQTLSRHGLLPGMSGEEAAFAPLAMPLMADLMAKVQPTARVPEIPEGATFDEARIDCDAGSRNYRVYVPASARDGVTGLVVMLHGCTQNPEDFAAGTGMNALAEANRFIVVYPQQSRGDNAQSCWSWFRRSDQRRDGGEPAILAAITRKVMAEHGVPPEETFVAGLSAGAAMALILGETYPDLFAAVGAHSGLPYGAARDVPSAYAAMAGQAADPGAPRADGPAPRTIVFHGTADRTVHPTNGERIAERVIARGPRDTIVTDERGGTGGRAFTRTTTMGPDGTILLEHWQVEGLGHAWSGGQPAGSHTDPGGPDASAEMIRFFFDTPAGAI